MVHGVSWCMVLVLPLYRQLFNNLKSGGFSSWILYSELSERKHLLSQPNSTQLHSSWSDKVFGLSTTHPTPPDKLLDQFQGTQEADFRFVNLIQPN